MWLMLFSSSQWGKGDGRQMTGGNEERGSTHGVAFPSSLRLAPAPDRLLRGLRPLLRCVSCSFSAHTGDPTAGVALVAIASNA